MMAGWLSAVRLGTQRLSGALDASPTSRGTLLYIDPRSGSVLCRLDVSSEPLDVAVR